MNDWREDVVHWSREGCTYVVVTQDGNALWYNPQTSLVLFLIILIVYFFILFIYLFFHYLFYFFIITSFFADNFWNLTVPR